LRCGPQCPAYSEWRDQCSARPRPKNEKPWPGVCVRPPCFLTSATAPAQQASETKDRRDAGSRKFKALVTEGVRHAARKLAQVMSDNRVSASASSPIRNSRPPKYLTRACSKRNGFHDRSGGVAGIPTAWVGPAWGLRNIRSSALGRRHRLPAEGPLAKKPRASRIGEPLGSEGGAGATGRGPTISGQGREHRGGRSP